ncbi:aminodeoxychorismate synthase [Teredinibacter waterburyi]|uniref:aminodeoxychorismate synthase n=1 Tax=Teredinibacter waterburyi TaxID=1500538 RepID=UPI00165EC735|nr:aminodeoxychorismate synthase [Teredinibacter waterburyi]
MKTLLIDNFDSFTYNLYQLIAEVNRVPPLVIDNRCHNWREVLAQGFDNIVISPGPGRPDREADFGICSDVLREAPLPILGVCLGHQGLCHLYGGRIDYATKVMHGRLSKIQHRGEDLFKNIPSPFAVVRYHSLWVSELPPMFKGLAYTDDGVLMAARHESKPLWGVQFHPESVCSEYGHKLLANFRDLSLNWLKEQGAAINSPQNVSPLNAATKIISNEIDGARSRRQESSLGIAADLQLSYRRLPFFTDAEAVFSDFFALSENSFWLDSASALHPSRFSYMGDATGPHAQTLCYRQETKTLDIQTTTGQHRIQTDMFEYLQGQLDASKISTDELPFDFTLGYVGYMGYEMKAAAGFAAPYCSKSPDASWIFADRMIVFDHEEQVVYLVCLEQPEQAARAEYWLQTMEVQLTVLADSIPSGANQIPLGDESWDTSEIHFRHTKASYLDLIEQAKQKILQGETYEVCLTNSMSVKSNAEPLQLYRTLRHLNPAPYASYLKFSGLHILCSSPERFLTIDKSGTVESKPIKGTRKRCTDTVEDRAIQHELAANEKDRAENLMIVDLLRNDLGQVCEVGSVQVPALFAVESYASVHQLVSTIRGRLRRDVSALDCLRACFPGGSMTGAPKRRTLEILDELEGGARGIYSGALGFLALNGSADFNIIIRTLVVEDGEASLGVGGAIVDMSDPESEWQETQVKAQALLQALSVTSS